MTDFEDLLHQIEDEAEAVGPAGRAYRLGFILYLVEQVFEVRHAQPQCRPREYDVTAIVAPGLEGPGPRLGAVSDTR